jgi:hypothetical protein
VRLQLRVIVISGMALALMLALAACGGDEEAVPAETSTAATNGELPLPTVDPDIPLTEYRSADKGYTVGYPSGWEVNAGEQLFGDIFFWNSESGRPLAQLTVSCNPDALTAEALRRIDAAAAAQFGSVESDSITPIEIAGTEGTQMRYRTSVEDLVIEQVAAYAPGDECGWRLGLAAYGSGALEPYLPLFDRIVASFQPG